VAAVLVDGEVDVVVPSGAVGREPALDALVIADAGRVS
jgi:hypothetical protein